MNIDVKGILQKADKLLYENIDDEIEQLKNSSHPVIINEEKYKKLEELFKKVISMEPDNKKAKQGIEICNDMLEEHLLVQYMAPFTPEMVKDEFLLPSVIDNLPGLSIKKDETTNIKNIVQNKKMPWEIRRKMLDDFKKSDREGIEYTSRVFSEQAIKAKNKAAEIIEMVKQEHKGKNGLVIFREIKYKLEEYQDTLNQGWKGHGPDILTEILGNLFNELVKNIDIKKLDKIKDQLQNSEISSCTVDLKTIEIFIDIFSYKNKQLISLKQWIKEILELYLSLEFSIKIFSDGRYSIDAFFPEKPEKKPDKVFLTLPLYNEQKEIYTDQIYDLYFLSLAWDAYFPELLRLM